MTNYQQAKIYLLYSYRTNKKYIGSTTKKLSKRLSGHCSDYRRYKQGKSNYVTSFKVCRYADVDICLLENYPCDSSDELKARERQWIEKYKEWMDEPEVILVNKNRPTRTKQEHRAQMRQWYQDNREKQMHCMKEYYRKNKEENRKEQLKTNLVQLLEKYVELLEEMNHLEEQIIKSCL